MLPKIFIYVIIAVILIIPANLVLELPVIRASPEPVNEDVMPPISGSGFTAFNRTWYVDTNETLYYGNQTIDLEGDLIINTSGKLIFYNVTLMFNETFDGEYGIEVMGGGLFDLTDTTITSVNNFTYTFEVHSQMNMENCNISRMYFIDTGPTPHGGVEIYNGNVTINNSYFHHNANTFYVNTPLSARVNITNNVVVDPLRDQFTNVTSSLGVAILGASDPYIYNNEFHDQLMGINIVDTATAVIDNNLINNSEDVGILLQTNGPRVDITNNEIGYSQTYDAIWVEDPSLVLIENNTLHHCSDSGVWYESMQMSTIKNNHMYKNSWGIYIDGSSSWLYGNVIENNSEVGIELSSVNGPTPVIELNTILRNGIGFGTEGYGILVDSSGGRITRNEIMYNGPDLGAGGSFQGGGIFVTSGSAVANPRIDNNTINYNDRNGIDIDAQSRGAIFDNTIAYNNGTGLYITQASTTIQPSGNTIRYNKIGIHYETNSGHIVHNLIEYNWDYGVLLESGSGPTLYDNTIIRNGNDSGVDAGVFIDGSNGASNARLDSNEIANNTGAGVKIKLSTPDIRNNYINYNTEGISINLAGGTIQANNINFNSVTGIRTETASSLPMIRANTIDNNGIGVGIYSGSRPTVNDNWFRGNDRGIYVTGWSWPSLQNNNVNTNRIGLNTEYSRIETSFITFNGNTEVAVEAKGTNFTLDNCTISNSGTSGVRMDDNSHIIMLNTAFDKSAVVYTDSKSEIKTYWYLDLLLEDDQGNPLVNGYVEVRNATGRLSFGRLIPGSGSFSYITLKEYSELKSGRVYTTPHSVFAEKTSFEKLTQQVTMDISKFLKMSLEENFDPTPVSNIKPRRVHNLTPLITWDPAVDPDGDQVKYIVNIGTAPLADNVVNDAEGETTNNFFQITEPLTFGDGNQSYFITIYARDGIGGESMAENAMFVINHQPLPPKVEISPGRPNKLTGLMTTILTPSFDEDNDTVTYDYTWYKNDEIETSLSEAGSSALFSIIPSEFTNDGENWLCTVQAFDGYFYSPVVETGEVLVLNFAPHLNDTPFAIEINEDTIAENAFNLEYVFIDDNDEELSYSWTTAKNIQVIENGTWITFKPGEDWNGEVKFTFTAADLFSEVSFDIALTVKPVNDPPVLDPVGDLVMKEDEWFNFTIVAFDHADDDLIFYNTNLTTVFQGRLMTDINFKFSLNTGDVSIKPDNSMVGTYSVNITARDDKNVFDFEIINFTVLNVNDFPNVVIVSPLVGQTYQVGDVISLNGSSTDEDMIFGDHATSVMWMVDSEVISTSITGTHVFEKHGTYLLTLIVTDSNGSSGSASLTITVKKAPAEDEPEGLIESISGSPAAIAGISIVVIILVLIVLTFLFLAMRSRKDRKKMVEAGLLTEDDLKKAKEMPETPEPGEYAAPWQLPGGQQEAVPGSPMPQPVSIPGTAPSGLPGQTEPPALPPGEMADDGEDVPDFRDTGQKKVEEEVPKAPTFGPSISMDDVQTQESTDTIEDIEEAPEPPSDDIPVVEGEAVQGEAPTVVNAQPVQKVVQGAPVMPVQQPQQQMPPVYPGVPMMPQLQCPDCGSAAQFHPMNRRIIVCPMCGPLKTV